jgi:hypothetical protein
MDIGSQTNACKRRRTPEIKEDAADTSNDKPCDQACEDRFNNLIKAEIKSCNDFRNIIWKAATSAAFAVRGEWVVAWVKYSTVPT